MAQQLATSNALRRRLMPVDPSQPWGMDLTQPSGGVSVNIGEPEFVTEPDPDPTLIPYWDQKRNAYFRQVPGGEIEVPFKEARKYMVGGMR
jgi:hypothetical protein